MGQAFSVQNHPYYPQNVDIQGYVPSAGSILTLGASFGSVLAITSLTAVYGATKYNPGLRLSDKFILGWFVLCGTLHCFFEGYFVYNHASIAGSQNPLAQLWKHYALSDSRYLTSDTFLLCAEAITVLLWGPLSFATAVTIAHGSGLRHPLQIIVSVAHLYGVALYFSTSFVNEKYKGLLYSRPEPLYYWGYYIGLNALWVLVPTAILTNSVRFVHSATVAVDEASALYDRKRDDASSTTERRRERKRDASKARSRG